MAIGRHRDWRGWPPFSAVLSLKVLAGRQCRVNKASKGDRLGRCCVLTPSPELKMTRWNHVPSPSRGPTACSGLTIGFRCLNPVTVARFHAIVKCPQDGLPCKTKSSSDLRLHETMVCGGQKGVTASTRQSFLSKSVRYHSIPDQILNSLAPATPGPCSTACVAPVLSEASTLARPSWTIHQGHYIIIHEMQVFI